ncbi:hypothetical protein NXS19_001448 [Fusarium pseudograminearum]|nr:hypothetical protein NXS19_001448 [Fusarium pseudograminearum]
MVLSLNSSLWVSFGLAIVPVHQCLVGDAVDRQPRRESTNNYRPHRLTSDSLRRYPDLRRRTAQYKVMSQVSGYIQHSIG